MTLRNTPIVVHLLGAALASALAAYWLMLLFAAAPPVHAAPAPALPVRDPDARLAARLFGDLNGAPAALARNIQVYGVYAAGAGSSAVLAVDGKPARVIFLGQDAASGLRLVDVRANGITLDADGARTDYTVPAVSVARGSTGGAQFRREGNTLTAPSQDAATVRSPATAGGASPGGRFNGAVPALPSGMLIPPSPRGGSDDTAGRPAPPGAGGAGAAPGGSAN